MPEKRTIPCTCLSCGNEFLTGSTSIKRGRGRYCSRVCAARRVETLPQLKFSADGTTALIPLLSRDGSLWGHAIVDAEDGEWANQWRWCQRRGYASRNGARSHGRQHAIYLHRELLGLPWISDGREGDHINRNRLDCRRANLRILPKGGNQQNPSVIEGALSRFRGVTWNPNNKKWVAGLSVNGTYRYVGFFKDEEEAARAVLEARRRHMPYAVD
jgi:hypothetical protein